MCGGENTVKVCFRYAAVGSGHDLCRPPVPPPNTSSARSGKDKLRNPTILRKSKTLLLIGVPKYVRVLNANPFCNAPELDLCIYLMSAVGVKMEVEEGASATVVELINTLMDEDELGLPRNQQQQSANPSKILDCNGFNNSIFSALFQ